MVKKLQQAYQADADHKKLLSHVKEKNIERMSLADISRISSRHDEDNITVEAGEESMDLDFLNLATKTHAL